MVQHSGHMTTIEMVVMPVTNLNVLYTDPANLTFGLNPSLSMITVQLGTTAFSLQIKGNQVICGKSLRSTEHPQLFAFVSNELQVPTPLPRHHR